MKYTVDSIEDNVVKLECDGNDHVFVSIEKLPSDVREGDILYFDGKCYIVDVDATAERRKAVYEKFNRLFRKEKK